MATLTHDQLLAKCEKAALSYAVYYQNNPSSGAAIAQSWADANCTQFGDWQVIATPAFQAAHPNGTTPTPPPTPPPSPPPVVNPPSNNPTNACTVQTNGAGTGTGWGGNLSRPGMFCNNSCACLADALPYYACDTNSLEYKYVYSQYVANNCTTAIPSTYTQPPATVYQSTDPNILNCDNYYQGMVKNWASGDQRNFYLVQSAFFNCKNLTANDPWTQKYYADNHIDAYMAGVPFQQDTSTQITACDAAMQGIVANIGNVSAQAPYVAQYNSGACSVVVPNDAASLTYFNDNGILDQINAVAPTPYTAPTGEWNIPWTHHTRDGGLPPPGLINTNDLCAGVHLPDAQTLLRDMPIQSVTTHPYSGAGFIAVGGVTGVGVGMLLLPELMAFKLARATAFGVGGYSGAIMNALTWDLLEGVGPTLMGCIIQKLGLGFTLKWLAKLPV